MLMKVQSANAATSTSAEKISGQTNKQTYKQTNKQTNKLDQSQDIVTGNAHVSCKKSYNIDLISAYLPGNSDLHNSSRSNVIELNEI